MPGIPQRGGAGDSGAEQGAQDRDGGDIPLHNPGPAALRQHLCIPPRQSTPARRPAHGGGFQRLCHGHCVGLFKASPGPCKALFSRVPFANIMILKTWSQVLAICTPFAAARRSAHGCVFQRLPPPLSSIHRHQALSGFLQRARDHAGWPYHFVFHSHSLTDLHVCPVFLYICLVFY